MTVQTVSKPLPQIDPDNEAFWQACRDHELKIQKCKACGNTIHLPRPMCNICHSMDTEWVRVGLSGKVYSWTIVQRAVHPSFADVPYAVALVQLDDAPEVKLVGRLEGCAFDQIRPDMPVGIEFEDLPEEVSIPFFRAPQTV